MTRSSPALGSRGENNGLPHVEHNQNMRVLYTTPRRSMCPDVSLRKCHPSWEYGHFGRLRHRFGLTQSEATLCLSADTRGRHTGGYVVQRIIASKTSSWKSPAACYRSRSTSCPARK